MLHQTINTYRKIQSICVLKYMNLFVWTCMSAKIWLVYKYILKLSNVLRIQRKQTIWEVVEKCLFDKMFMQSSALLQTKASEKC